MSIEVSGFRPGIAEVRAELRRKWAAEGLQSPLNLHDAIRQGLAHNTGRLAMQTEHGLTEISAQDLHDQAIGLAGALHKLGVRPGDVVAMQLPNWPQTMALTLGILYAGAIVLPVVPIYGAKELGFILRQSRAKLLFVPERWGNVDYLEALTRLGSLPDLEQTIVLGERAPEGGLLWREFAAQADPAFQPPTVAADALCVLLYTSGTTSDPKGVLHTHQTVQGFMETASAPANRARSILATPQTGHIGHIIQLINVMWVGETVATMDRWSPETAARLIDKYKSASMAGAPVFLYSTLDTAKALGLDVSSIVEVRLGSTAIMPSDIEAWAEMGLLGYRCYGSTEHALATGKWAHPTSSRIRAHTDGLPNPGTQVRIVDDDGVDVPQGQPGEVVLLGPPQFIGYFDPALNADHFLDGGWFKTGDIGVLDDDGALKITDRKKDIIIRGGENISAKEVEDTLARLPWVVEAAAVAMPDERLVEKVCAYLIARDPPAEPLAAVREHFAAVGIAKQKTPERIEILTDFPRTPTGKIKKFELRQWLKDEFAAKASQPA